MPCQESSVTSPRATCRMYSASLKSGLYRYFIPDPSNPLVISGVKITRNSPLLVDAKTGALKAQVPLCGGSVTKGCVATYNIFANDPLKIGGDPTIAALIAKFPLPNDFSVTGDGLNTGGFVWNPPTQRVGPNYLIRLDHIFNDRNNLFGRIIWGDWNATRGDVLNSRPSVYPGFPPLGQNFRASQNLALSYRRTFSPNLVNEFTTGFSRFKFLFTFRENYPAGQDPPPYAQTSCFGTTSFRNIDTPFCNTPHTKRAVSNIQFLDNLSYIRGAHTLRTGFNFRFYRHNDERGVPGGFNMSPVIITPGASPA